MIEINDAYDAAKIALDYLSKKGKVVFGREVESIFRDHLLWFITIDSLKFTGYVIIKAKNGDVIKEVMI